MCMYFYAHDMRMQKFGACPSFIVSLSINIPLISLSSDVIKTKKEYAPREAKM